MSAGASRNAPNRRLQTRTQGSIPSIRRKRGVSAEMALKLGRRFNVSPELWMGIQADYDLEMARERSEAEIFRRVQPMKMAEPVTA